MAVTPPTGTTGRTIRLPDDSCWSPGRRGFLIHPDPVVDLAGVEGLSAGHADLLDELGRRLPELIAEDQLVGALAGVPVIDVEPALADGRVAERLFQLYSHVANALVHDPRHPTNLLPANIAVPFDTVAAALGRPPALSYAATALANFQRVDPDGPVEVDNLRLVQALLGDDDEAGFHLVHVQIEAEAAAVLRHLVSAAAALARQETEEAEVNLALVAVAVLRMSAVFSGVTKRCQPERFFHTLRPYLFGYDGVVFGGVHWLDGPQTIRGQSAAQSSVVPAIQRHLGIRHSAHELGAVQLEMLAHMPAPHRAHLESIDDRVIREGVISSGSAPLREAYNRCVEALADFRSLHLGMAHLYVASRVEDPTGTGGTEFMPWLRGLRDETRAHLLGPEVTVSLPGEIQLDAGPGARRERTPQG